VTHVEAVAYFAGILDGEGTVDWKNPDTIRVRVPKTRRAA
jgi:hypothetical protein